MVTNSETTLFSATWFKWLKIVVKFVPTSIMIDCSLVEINALYQVYSDVVKILLCHWHTKIAWKKHVKKLVELENSTNGTAEKQGQARATLNPLMQCDNISMSDVHLKRQDAMKMVM